MPLASVLSSLRRSVALWTCSYGPETMITALLIRSAFKSASILKPSRLGSHLLWRFVFQRPTIAAVKMGISPPIDRRSNTGNFFV